MDVMSDAHVVAATALVRERIRSSSGWSDDLAEAFDLAAAAILAADARQLEAPAPETRQ